MPLVTPPSFMSHEPLSARFHFAPRGTNAHTMTLGTTGHSFIQHAWKALQRIDFSRDPLRAKAYANSYEGPFSGLRTGTGFNTFPAPGRGERWDNDFNRALWAWTFLKWNEQTVRMNMPTATDQFFHGVPSELRSGWVDVLNKIEWCEVNQSVSKEAMTVAALLVADSLGLVDNVTTPRVSFDQGTVWLRYNTNPPLPPQAARTAGSEFKVWSRGDSPDTGRYLADRPQTHIPSTPGGTQGGAQGGGGGGTGQGTSGDEGGAGGPLGRPGGLSETASTALTVTAVVGGFLLVAGLGVYLTAPDDGGF